MARHVLMGETKALHSEKPDHLRQDVFEWRKPIRKRAETPTAAQPYPFSAVTLDERPYRPRPTQLLTDNEAGRNAQRVDAEHSFGRHF